MSRIYSSQFCLVLFIIGVTSVPMFRRDVCTPAVTKVEPQEGFNATMFEGKWFVLARTNGPWQGHTWAASVTNFRLSGQNIHGKYSLHHRRYGGCIPGMNAVLEHTETPGRYTAVLSSNLPIRGNYTVYHLEADYAITYECYQFTAEGLCSKRGRMVAILGRKRPISPRDSTPAPPPEELVNMVNRLKCPDERLLLVDHTMSCENRVVFRQKRDIIDAEHALNTQKVFGTGKVPDEDIFRSDLLGPEEVGSPRVLKCILEPCFEPCLHGTRTSGDGCPTCDCLPNPDPSAAPCPELDCPSCEHGEHYDKHGCRTCICKLSCPETKCEQNCTYGNKKDDFNCPTCRCNEAPKDMCRKPLCENTCEYNRQTGENGCPTCQCLCPATSCWHGPCLYGSVKDASGCETCDCKRPKLPTISCPYLLCPVRCAYGSYKDSKGCDSCVCKDPPPGCVQPGTCSESCPYGYSTDERGCVTCNCKQKPQKKPCPILDCDLSCMSGYEMNENNCAICKCKCQELQCDEKCPKVLDEKSGCHACDCKGDTPVHMTESPCKKLVCTEDCPNGRAMHNGCPVCACEDSQCPSLNNCFIRCNHGFLVRNGCPVCECPPALSSMQLPVPVEVGSGIADSPEAAIMAIPGTHAHRVITNDYPTYDFSDNSASGLGENFLGNIQYVDPGTLVYVDGGGVSYRPKERKTGSNTDLCPLLDCQHRCPHGHELDSKGCRTCKCKVGVGCPVLMCSSLIRCDFGRVKDERGCDTCTCTPGGEVRGFEAGEGQQVARTVVGQYPDEVKNFGGEAEMFAKKNQLKLRGPLAPATKASAYQQGMAEMTHKTSFLFSCPAKRCMNRCYSDRLLDEKGCMSCQCKNAADEHEGFVECPSLTCLNQCSNGRKRDLAGCLKCECSETVSCPTLLCQQSCSGSRLLDANGCQTCECANKVVGVCKANTCNKACPYGYRKDSKGCEICECNCAQLRCWDGPCLFGSKKDALGCETCDCLREAIPMISCPYLSCKDGPCRYGWYPDRRGCASCKCKKHELSCVERVCKNECEGGYVDDEVGCPTCECLPPPPTFPPCKPLACAQECEKYREDEFGCPTCACACREVRNLGCSQPCPNGNLLDTKGCATCKCQSNVIFDLPEIINPNERHSRDNNHTDFTAVKEPLIQKESRLNDGDLPESLARVVCPTLTCWDGPCLFGSIPNPSNDCETCNCVTTEDTVCPELKCTGDTCIYGSYYDRHGCDTCNCKPNPSLHCPDLSSCPLRCANGYKENDRGCKICECFVLVPPPLPCHRITCDQACPYSYKTDEHGCKTCACGCGKPVCWNGDCLHGSELDINGCETCQCLRPTLPIISCGLLDCRGRECPHGYRKDRHGCHTCFCKEENEYQIESHFPKQKPNCSEDLSLCPFACMYGNVEANNCLTCECKEATASHLPAMCPLLDCGYCRYGYEQDMNACATCQCKSPPPAALAALTCMKDCSELCHYNYISRKDANGCLQCTCIPKPKTPFGKPLQKDRTP